MELKDETMQSVIYESNMRAMFPVEGCCGILRDLQSLEQNMVAELVYVQSLIATLNEKLQKLQIPSTSSSNCSSKLQSVFKLKSVSE